VAHLKALAVDPDPTALALLVNALSGAGYEVEAAGDFRTAGHHLSAGPFDAVVTAHHLGPHNGLHLLLRAGVASPAAVAVVVSHFGDPHLETEASSLGAIAVITSALDPSPVVAALQNALKTA
jgi:DNA-binding NtrC family response regulator